MESGQVDLSELTWEQKEQVLRCVWCGWVCLVSAGVYEVGLWCGYGCTVWVGVGVSAVCGCTSVWVDGLPTRTLIFH